MVNDDVDFDLDVLSVMLNDFKRANDSLCAIVGSTHDSIGNHSYGGIHWNGKAIGEISEHIVPNGELQLCEQTNWNCFMIPVGLYNLIGKIDDFYEHSAADYDYSNRITKAGYKIYVASKYIGSSIENSPNSLGEAMLLGVPVVTSDVGGVKNMINHGVEGYVYPADEPYMLAHYVMEIFTSESKTIEMSQEARKHAMNTHDPDKNYMTLMNIYGAII